MTTTRAKFLCTSIKETMSGKVIELNPVTGVSEENKNFFKWTPSGKIEMGIVNDNVKFLIGKEYYVDFTLAEEA